MKILALTALAAIAVACDSPTSPPPAARQLARVSNAVVTNERVETAAIAVNDCNGGSLLLTATFHDVVAVTDDGNGGFHLMEHENVEGQGTDPVTGTDYVVMQTVNIGFNATAAIEETVPEHFNMIAKGSAPNEVLLSDFHVTVTPNGDFTSFHDNFRLMCQ